MVDDDPIQDADEADDAETSAQIKSSEWNNPEVYRGGSLPWLRPDGRVQVTVEYEKGTRRNSSSAPVPCGSRMRGLRGHIKIFI